MERRAILKWLCASLGAAAFAAPAEALGLADPAAVLDEPGPVEQVIYGHWRRVGRRTGRRVSRRVYRRHYY